MTQQAPASARLAYSERDLDALGILSRKTRWRMRRAGTFPQPAVAGGRKLYRATDILQWLDNPGLWAEANQA
jgi:predicted DNA-binding transcriptional regulator AlpA